MAMIEVQLDIIKGFKRIRRIKVQREEGLHDAMISSVVRHNQLITIIMRINVQASRKKNNV